jgi:hypothetical protein
MVYARSAADDKAPIVAILAAVDAIGAAGLTMRSNIKFAFEGEEEAGSSNLEKILAANKDLFSGSFDENLSFRTSGTASSSWLPCWRCDDRLELVNALEQRPCKSLRLVLSRAADKQSPDHR